MVTKSELAWSIYINVQLKTPRAFIKINVCLYPPIPCMHAGGLLCRGFLEAYSDHNVRTFVSLSSPQAGQFGGERFENFTMFNNYFLYASFIDTEYVKHILPNATRDFVYL